MLKQEAHQRRKEEEHFASMTYADHNEVCTYTFTLQGLSVCVCTHLSSACL